ncbi:uncharacterized protein LOC134778907 [Penaeus indicus]|uniref:uncharacterized protein LOC134778907 n=1 Tax=Penaeus indicus TaxID=29960 RepID=UPI00300DB964
MVVPEMNLETPFSSNLIMSAVSEERHRVRRSAGASSRSVTYGSSVSLKLRLKGDQANFLQATADGGALAVGLQQNSETAFNVFVRDIREISNIYLYCRHFPKPITQSSIDGPLYKFVSWFTRVLSIAPSITKGPIFRGESETSS